MVQALLGGGRKQREAIDIRAVVQKYVGDPDWAKTQDLDALMGQNADDFVK